MTIGELVDPVMVPVAFVIAILSALWMITHLARGYPSVPKRIPARILIDGRPSRGVVEKRSLWLAPALLAATIVALGAVLLVAKPPLDESTRPILALAFVICAEVVYFVTWITDRTIEVARKMTYRIAPARTLRVALPLLVTAAAALALAARL